MLLRLPIVAALAAAWMSAATAQGAASADTRALVVGAPHYGDTLFH